MGYCPFESRYNGLYRDTGLGRRGLGTARGPRHGKDSATIRPSEGHDTADLRAGRAVVHAHGLARGSRDTNCIVAGGGLVGHDTVRGWAVG